MSCAPDAAPVQDGAVPEQDGAAQAPDVATNIATCDTLPAFTEERRASSSEAVREALAAEVAFQLPSPSAERVLRGLLADSAASVRTRAFTSLATLGYTIASTEAPRGITTPLGSVSEANLGDTRQAVGRGGAEGGWAAAALSVYGDGSDLPALRTLATDANVFARFQAALALIALGDATTGDGVIAAIANLTPSISEIYYVLNALRVQRERGVAGSTERLLSTLSQLEVMSEPNAQGQAMAQFQSLARRHCVWRDSVAGWRAWMSEHDALRP